MTDKQQPEALRLADELEEPIDGLCVFAQLV